MKQINRLKNRGHIDRSTIIKFCFNGKPFSGFAGDTIASALLANDVSIVGRSFKYRRLRGIMCCDVSEPNAIMQVESGADTVPNVIATQAEIYDGMEVWSVNCWPNPKYDLRSITQLFSKIMPVGFYYKTFMWPRCFWKGYERIIRSAAGFGKSPKISDVSKYDSRYAHCEILIVGAGIAGITAALEAAKSGLRVILVDENAEFGGGLLYRKAKIDNKASHVWAAEMVRKLESYENITLLNRSTAFGYYDHNLLYVLERIENHLPVQSRQKIRERVWKVRAKKVILATGALERPMLFQNNDKVGVMLASAVLKYLNLYAVSPGRKYVIYTNNDSAYQSVFALNAIKDNIVTVIDSRSSLPTAIELKLKENSIELYLGYVVGKALGSPKLKSALIWKRGTDILDVSKKEIRCDVLASSGGWNPVIHLSSQSGAKAIYSSDKNCFLPGEAVQDECSIGSCAGVYDVKEIIEQTQSKISQTLKCFDKVVSEKTTISVDSDDPSSGEEFFLPGDKEDIHRVGEQFVDMQNDVTVADIALAAREGYHSIEHVKRYTALGFGTDQGKLGNVLGMDILANLLGKKPHEVGTTTFRPAYTPVTFGAMAGMNIHGLFAPVRKTPLHYWHEEHGATFEDVGDWKRAWYYPRPFENMHEALNRESLATHDSVGIMDASTLGKIDIYGPDAAKFLNLIYTNPWLKLGVGRCRYGLMLGEDGMVMDDGITMRLSENHFVMTTTTGGAAKILTWLERYLQTQWPELKVYLTSVTDHFSAMAISGPNSRKLVSALCPEMDVSSEEFPFMAVKDGLVAGVPARVMRISFTGELSYEIHVDSNYARMVLEAVMREGRKFNVSPYGTETMHILRAEKGFIIVGQDTDGTVTPEDLGMGWVVGKKKKDFLGKRSLSRSAMLLPDRKQFVGLVTENPKNVIPEGAQLVNSKFEKIPMSMQGYVTSSYYSAVLKKSIALALVKSGFQREGEDIYAALADGSFIKATITKSVFYDPEGNRQNV